MKKYISIIIGIITAFTASADVTIDNITYVLDDTNMEARVKTSLSGVSFADNKVTIPEKITNDEKEYTVVGIESFSNDGAKHEMVLPSSVTYIKSVKAGIVTLNVSASVSSITDMTESVDLLDFKVDEGNATYCDIDGVLYSKDKKTLVYMPFGRNSSSTKLEYTVPDGVERIGEYAFYNMTNVKSVAFPSDLQSVGHHAFQGCTGLGSLSFPDGLKSIEGGAFYECTGIPSLTFPAGLEELGSSAFSLCKNVTKITSVR